MILKYFDGFFREQMEFYCLDPLHTRYKTIAAVFIYTLKLISAYQLWSSKYSRTYAYLFCMTESLQILGPLSYHFLTQILNSSG